METGHDFSDVVTHNSNNTEVRIVSYLPLCYIGVKVSIYVHTLGQ